ncbi:MAG: glycosyltransferase [Bacteroidota bacterium]|nr:glycosyltransferase [Bacteroidota bacterium]
MIKKKILIVGPAHPLRGGLATYDERLCREFKAMGHQCEILSFSLQYPGILFPGKTQFSAEPKPDDIVIHAEINSINPLNWFHVGNRFAKNNYDLIVFRYWMSFMAPAFGTIARIIKKKSNARIVAITDNIIPHEKRFYDKSFTNYFLKSIDGFLSMSREVFAQVAILEPNKPKVYVPHPMYDMFGPAIDKAEAKQKLGLEPKTNYLLFFGFIRKYKGLNLLLESFAKVDRKTLNLKLIVAGEFYEDAQPYYDQLKELALSDDVILRTDFIPNSEVSTYFSACDLVVQTYLSATQSGVTQIAYYYNKPMLVTDVGGLAELVPHNKVGYVCKLEPNEIAASITSFYTENKEADFVNGLIEERKKFTWDYLCQQLLGL